MRLMIFTPTWLTEAGEEAIHPACRESIEALKIEGSIRWVVGRENPFPVPDHRNVLHQYRSARALFLAGEEDALLTVEHDHALPDPGAVQRMLDTSGDVVYAPYLLRHGWPVLSTWQYINDRNLGMSLSNYRDELERAVSQVVWRICGAGFGCTLFRRRVLERIEFGPSAVSNPSPDLGFAEAALRARFVSYGRFDVPVYHYARGRWLDPFEEMKMTTFVALQTVNVKTSVRFLRLIKGKAYELSQAEADELSRMGYIELPEAVEDTTLPQAMRSEKAVARPQRRNRARTIEGMKDEG